MFYKYLPLLCFSAFPWSTLSFVAGATSTEGLQCYACDSEEGAGCTEFDFGETDDCEAGHGCVIVVDSEGGYRRECSKVADVEDYCTEGGDGGETVTECQCSTSLCNSNLASAGYTPFPPAPPSISCYRCSSSDGGHTCSDEDYGVEQLCQPGDGCLLSRETKPGVDDFFVRECLPGEEVDNSCDTHDGAEEGVILKKCTCSTELCNKNWVEAGSTEQQTDTTKPPSDPLKCFSCDSQSSGQCTDDFPGPSKLCEAGHGCMISLETKEGHDDVLIRDCSQEYGPEAQYDCTEIDGESATIRTCNCDTQLCNRNWDDAGYTPHPTDAPTQPPGDTVKCYSCDSNTGECDDTHFGDEKSCPQEDGCVLKKDLTDGKTNFFRDCAGVLEPQPGWNGCSDQDGVVTCICHGPLCNQDWSSAGSTTASSDTTPSGPSIRCYRCDANTEKCSDEVRGEEVECPGSSGCTIRKTIGKDGDMLKRDCSSEKDVLCDTIDNGEDEGTTQFCNCDTSLCNADWSTAGSTHSPPDTTHDTHTTQGDTTITTPAPGAATTLHYSSLIATLATLSFML